MRAMADFVRGLGQQRAVSNARVAATELSRRRVEREDVELYFATRGAVAAGEPVAGEGGDTREAQRG